MEQLFLHSASAALANTTASSAMASGDLIGLLKDVSLVGKFVLVMLMVFSIVSWAVIIFKMLEYGKARKHGRRFVDYFRKTKNFADINKFSTLVPANPLSEIFKSGFRSLSAQVPSTKQGKPLNIPMLERSLYQASNLEITRLERLNGFLATTASATPFIGLFGTVWGIMLAFQEIGLQQNANLATVAPGIAEALINTALGLFAAIPAVIFYNLLLNKLKVLISDMDDFVGEFLTVSENLEP
jgi:biopolymer transport protein TolQ